jgi:hypothetical protein
LNFYHVPFLLKCAPDVDATPRCLPRATTNKAK